MQAIVRVRGLPRKGVFEQAMPRIYRSMKRADDGKPQVDASGKGLGIRGSPVNGVVDYEADLAKTRDGWIIDEA